MTIAAYLQQIEQANAHMTPRDPEQGSFADWMKEAADVWNNEACKGYCIAAAIAAGLDRKQTGKLMDALRAAFDEMSVDEAEQFYQSGEY